MAGMLTLKVTVDDGGARRQIDVIFRSARDVKPVFKRWLGAMRSDAKERFDTQSGWPSPAESTRARLRSTGTGKVTKFGRVRASYAKRLTAGLKAAAARAERSGDAAGAARARSDLAAARRLARHGAAAEVQGPQGRAVTRLGRALAKAKKGRATAGKRRAADGHRLLGRLPRSLRGEVSADAAVLESSAPWSAIHNEGGTAGHGAKIPARPFLILEAADAERLAQIALDHFMGGGEL